jgi:hypothetical protein
VASSILPRPTPDELIKAEIKFNSENRAGEWTLSQIFLAFPQNVALEEVGVKVKVLNVLYGTQIRAVSIVADHIVRLGIDPDLKAGEPEVVDRVAKVRLTDTIRNNFSFASKYCSWHNPEAYPIYDSKVEACLWYYKKKDGFATFRRDNYNYREFVRRVNAFQNFYGLTSFNFKQLDKLLYHLGDTLLSR